IESPPVIVKGDAVDTVATVLDAQPHDAVAVVTTTWALAYLSRERRVAFRQALQAVSENRDVAWIAGEAPGVVDVLGPLDVPDDPAHDNASVLSMVLFRRGEIEPHLLGWVHAHGRWIDWRG
ncbi:MAG: DUF2332 family protein, partial [Acidimicrobiales bacterium]